MYKKSRTNIHNPNKPVFAWKCMEIQKKTSSHTFGEVSGKKKLPENDDESAEKDPKIPQTLGQKDEQHHGWWFQPI